MEVPERKAKGKTTDENLAVEDESRRKNAEGKAAV